MKSNNYKNKKTSNLAKTASVFGIILMIVYFFTINWYVSRSAEQYIVNPEDVPAGDAILVLGAYVEANGNVSWMLHDRLTVGYELYQKGKAPKILVSGDHGQQDYDEVNAMKSFIISKGVTGEDVFMDHAGFSTYESIYRARDIFQIKKIIVVTQGYHLPRALFIARSLGLEAYGVASDLNNYGDVMGYYNFREMAARNKDFVLARILKPEPTFLGEAIPVSGSGSATDDK